MNSWIDLPLSERIFMWSWWANVVFVIVGFWAACQMFSTARALVRKRLEEAKEKTDV